MATMYFAQRVLVGYKTVDVPGAPPQPNPAGTDKTIDFDPVSNPVLTTIIAHEPKRLGLTLDNTTLTLDGNPFPVNPDSSGEQSRKRIAALIAKAATGPLTNAELTKAVVALVKRVSDLDMPN